MSISKSRAVKIPVRDVPVVAEADVVVVGGGTAGFVAAVAAARTGARTVLVERLAYLGGSLTGTYCTSPGFFGDSAGHQVIGGIGWEVMERMEDSGAAILDRTKWKAEIFPEAIKARALDMVTESGARLFLHAWASEPLMKNGAIRQIIVQSKSGQQAIEGKIFVDATGDADIAHGAGAPTEQLETGQLWQTSVDLTVCNVNSDKVIRWAKDNADRVVVDGSLEDKGETGGVRPMVSLIILEDKTEGLGNQGGIKHVGPMPTVKLLIHRSVSRVQGSVNIDGTDVGAITSAEIEARHLAMNHLSYLKRTVSGFEEAFVVGASQLGVRETRRIVGEYIISINDLLNNARFPDVIALNSRALDRHTKGEVFEITFLQGNHDIPYRALIPKKTKNLLVAGRSISSDHDANASLRGAATCLATGHAAGTAAALVAESGRDVRGVDIKDLQRVLEEQRAILVSE